MKIGVDSEFIAFVRKLNPIRPLPRLNPICYKFLRLVYENNP